MIRKEIASNSSIDFFIIMGLSFLGIINIYKYLTIINSRKNAIFAPMTTDTELPDQDEQDLYEHLRIIVDKGQSLLRIDKFLMHRIENASRNRIQNAIEQGNVLVNDKAVKASYKVKPLDVISVVLPHPPRDTEVYPEDIPINIVYEDDDVLVVNKEPGMVVHPCYNNYTGTLVNAL